MDISELHRLTLRKHFCGHHMNTVASIVFYFKYGDINAAIVCLDTAEEILFDR